MFINFYPSKLLPRTSFPLIEGPEADLKSWPLFREGSVGIYLDDGFLEIIVLNGLDPLTVPFLIWWICLLRLSAILAKFFSSSESSFFVIRRSDNSFIRFLLSIVALLSYSSLFAIPWLVLSFTSTISLFRWSICRAIY